jgi:hypothetical protein
LAARRRQGGTGPNRASYPCTMARLADERCSGRKVSSLPLAFLWWLSRQHLSTGYAGSSPSWPTASMYGLVQTEKHSVRADVLRAAPKNGRWLSISSKKCSGSNVMEYRPKQRRLHLARNWPTDRIGLTGRHRLYLWPSQPSVTQLAAIPATSFPQRRTSWLGASETRLWVVSQLDFFGG